MSRKTRTGLVLLMIGLAPGTRSSRFAFDAHDRTFAGRARLPGVADEEMFDDFVDAGVLQAGELSVFVKGNVARAPDEAQAAEDSASFALEGL